ncbi:hypothetical protein GCM10027589_44230 [Actinocorallia lasiicapitis]
MNAVVLASAAPVAYVTGFAIFKTTARKMPTLSGNRPVMTAAQLATSPVWYLGLITILTGVFVQSLVMTELPVRMVVPMYGPVMLVLLMVSVGNFGERVPTGIWKALTTLLVALLALASASELFTGQTAEPGPWDTTPPTWKLALLVGPSVLVPAWMFVVRDKPRTGRHAKRVTGIAFGLGAGVLVGCAESAGVCIARILQAHPYDWRAVLSSPHPALLVGTGLFGLALAQIGLQRCRLSVVIVVLAIGSKVSLWLGGILVYGQPWPAGPVRFAATGAGLLLCIASVVILPRHEEEGTAAKEEDFGYAVPVRKLT